MLNMFCTWVDKYLLNEKALLLIIILFAILFSLVSQAWPTASHVEL